MGQYFKQSKITSFHRQLNLYGFRRLTQGRDNGGYYNEYFLRGKPLLTRRMIRIKVKGTKIRAASSPEDEPDFYNMTPSTANVRAISGQSSSQSSSGNRLPIPQDPSSAAHDRNQVMSSHSAAQGLIGLSCQGNTQSIAPKNMSAHQLSDSEHTNSQVPRMSNTGGFAPSFSAQRGMTNGQLNQDTTEQEVLLALLRNQQQQQLGSGLLNSSRVHDARNDQLSLLLSNLANQGLQQPPSNLPQQAPTAAALSGGLPNISQMIASMQHQSAFSNGCSSQSQFQDILSMRAPRHGLVNNGGVGNSNMFLHQSPQTNAGLNMSALTSGPSLSSFQNVRNDDLELLLLQMQLRRMNQGRANNLPTS